MFDPDDDELFEEGFLNGHDVYRDDEDGGIWYDGYYCADASDYDEAEMEYMEHSLRLFGGGAGEGLGRYVRLSVRGKRGGG